MAAHGFEQSVVSDVFLPLALAVIMFGMGLNLRVRDFTVLAREPRGVLAGLAGQLLLLPVLASAVVVVFVLGFDLAPPYALGLLLLAACPGGATSNLLTYLARGDHALSIVLTSITSLASFLTIPAALFLTTRVLFGQARTVEVAFVDLMVLVLFIVAIPVVVGMAVAARRPRLAERADKPLRIGGALFLAFLVAAVIYENRAGFWTFARLTVPPSLTLNLAALGGGLLIAWLARLGEARTRTLAVEVGFQNGTLGIVLALSQLNSPQAALVPGFYSLAMFVTGAAIAWPWSQREPAPEPRSGRPGRGQEEGPAEDIDVDFEVVVEPLGAGEAGVEPVVGSALERPGK